MEITGKIIFELERRSGTSARTGNSWASQSYVLETHDQYPRRMVFDVFGDDKIQQFNIKAGQELTVSFDIDARASTRCARCRSRRPPSRRSRRDDARGRRRTIRPSSRSRCAPTPAAGCRRRR